ncbi:MAG: hypothetical protein JRJ60_21290 [Deltaproteobacteria bacterium]|nr:hypothetical protein [Deltaproteobacteria bacterium]
MPFCRKKTLFRECLVLILLIFAPAAVCGETIDLKLNGDSLSAKIEDAPIKQIVQKLQAKKTIWVKGTENLPETNLSVEFEGLDFREGLERILSSLNYCLIYGTEGKLAGVIILSNPGAKAGPSRNSKSSLREKSKKQSSKRSSKRKR